MREGAFRGRHVLVTGGLGFIGSNLTRRLVEEGARVLVLDGLVAGSGGNPFSLAGLEGRVEVSLADLRDEHSTRHLVRGSPRLASPRQPALLVRSVRNYELRFRPRRAGPRPGGRRGGEPTWGTMPRATTDDDA